MKKLFITILIILACIFIGDRIIGSIMWQVTRQTKDTTAPKMKYLYSDVDDEIVLLGTSRCNNHYVSSIIEDSLGMSCYNGGIDGSENIYAQYCMLNIMLSHHKPKMICLDVSSSFYTKGDDPFRTMTFFAPYIGVSTEVDSLFKLAGTYNIYQVSHIMRYNAKAVSNIAGCLFSPHQPSEKGYLPSPLPTKFPEKKDSLQIGEIDSLRMKYMQKFIDVCRKDSITLVFSISPMFSDINEKFYKPLYEFANINKVPVFDYHTNKLFANNPDYFRDTKHLWDKGAREFTSIFAHDLKSYVENNRK